MRFRGAGSKLLLCLIMAQSGCAWFSGNKQAENDDVPEARGFLDKAPNWNKDVEDPYGYVGQAAAEARPPEKEPDPWYRFLFMSPEARNIERNLGIVE